VHTTRDIMSFLTRREAKKAEEKDLQMSPQGTAKKRAYSWWRLVSISLVNDAASRDNGL